MRPNLPIISLLLCCFFFNTGYSQQLPNSSVFGVTNFRFNPALTAAGEYLEWGVTYRQQWLGFDQAPQTGSAFVQYPLIYQNMSIGGSVGYDEAGPLRRNDLSLNYSYKLEVGTYSQLSIGILASLSQYRFNGNNALAADPGDQLILQSESTSMNPNFGAGLYFVSNTGMFDFTDNAFFMGIGANQLLANQLTFKEDSETNLQRAIHANGIIGGRLINDIGFFEPSIWVAYAAENIWVGTANLLFEMEETFWAGLSYHSDATLGLQGGLILTDRWLGGGQLRIGGAGNYNVGQLSAQKGMGFEVLVAYRFGL
jgi:type IX secretion system PorP/SprF family membrane protein